MKKRTIDKLTLEEFKHLTNLATGNYFSGDWTKDVKEVEVGGYGKRRRLQFTMNLEGYDEYHYLEISSESKNKPWVFSCNSSYELNKRGEPINYQGNIIIQNITKIVDYCRKQNLDIDNLF